MKRIISTNVAETVQSVEELLQPADAFVHAVPWLEVAPTNKGDTTAFAGWLKNAITRIEEI